MDFENADPFSPAVPSRECGIVPERPVTDLSALMQGALEQPLVQPAGADFFADIRERFSR